MTAEEREVLDLYRGLTGQRQRTALAALRGLQLLECRERERLQGRAFEVVEGGLGSPAEGG